MLLSDSRNELLFQLGLLVSSRFVLQIMIHSKLSTRLKNTPAMIFFSTDMLCRNLDCFSSEVSRLYRVLGCAPRLIGRIQKYAALPLSQHICVTRCIGFQLYSVSLIG